MANNTFNPEFPEEIQGPTGSNTGNTFNPDFPDKIQGPTGSPDGHTFNPDFPDEIQGPTGGLSGHTFNPDFPEKIDGPTSTQGGTYNPEFPDKIQGPTGGSSGRTFNPDFPEKIEGPTSTQGGTYNPEFPDKIQGPTGSYTNTTFNPEISFEQDPMLALAAEAGLDQQGIDEAINVGNFLYRSMAEGYNPDTDAVTWERGPDAGSGIEGMVEQSAEDDKTYPPLGEGSQASLLGFSIPGSQYPVRAITQLVNTLLGDRGQRLEQANYILQGTALIANAVNAPERLLNSPLGRALRNRGRVAANRAYWTLVGRQLGLKFRNQFSVYGHSMVPGYTQRPSPSQREDVAFGFTPPPHLQHRGQQVDIDRAGEIIERVINDDRLLPNQSRMEIRRGDQDPRHARSPGTLPANATLTDAARRAEETLRNPLNWQNYPDDRQRTDEQRQKTYEALDRKQNRTLDEVAGEDSRLQTNLMNLTVSHGTEGNFTRRLEYFDQANEEARVRDSDQTQSRETDAAIRARQQDTYGDLSDPGKDFLDWASHRLRWGNSYTHLFEVTLEDSRGYERDNPPPPIDDGDETHQFLDFQTAGNAFKFACVGASVGGMSLEMSRSGGMDLPLPSGADVAQPLTLTILDYTRMSIYNFFYAWWLNFYNPHKRRFVGGKWGKYKNIFINVQSWYGEYWKDDTNADDAGGETPPRNFGLNNRYDTVLRISAYNCMIEQFPGVNLNWSNNEPFEFEITVIPSDVYYDFRNPQNYTYRSNRPHLNELYKKELEHGRFTPDEIGRRIRDGVNVGDERLLERTSE